MSGVVCTQSLGKVGANSLAKTSVVIIVLHSVFCTTGNINQCRCFNISTIFLLFNSIFLYELAYIILCRVSELLILSNKNEHLLKLQVGVFGGVTNLEITEQSHASKTCPLII